METLHLLKALLVYLLSLHCRVIFLIRPKPNVSRLRRPGAVRAQPCSGLNHLSEVTINTVPSPQGTPCNEPASLEIRDKNSGCRNSGKSLLSRSKEEVWGLSVLMKHTPDTGHCCEISSHCSSPQDRYWRS